jgi:hypothetical protein
MLEVEESTPAHQPTMMIMATTKTIADVLQIYFHGTEVISHTPKITTNKNPTGTVRL